MTNWPFKWPNVFSFKKINISKLVNTNQILKEIVNLGLFDLQIGNTNNLSKNVVRTGIIIPAVLLFFAPL